MNIINLNQNWNSLCWFLFHFFLLFCPSTNMTHGYVCVAVAIMSALLDKGLFQLLPWQLCCYPLLLANLSVQLLSGLFLLHLPIVGHHSTNLLLYCPSFFPCFFTCSSPFLPIQWMISLPCLHICVVLSISKLSLAMIFVHFSVYFQSFFNFFHICSS